MAMDLRELATKPKVSETTERITSLHLNFEL